MRSLVFEGKTWLTYEQLREKDKKLHKALCKILKEMLRSDQLVVLENLRHLNIIYLVYGQNVFLRKID